MGRIPTRSGDLMFSAASIHLLIIITVGCATSALVAYVAGIFTRRSKIASIRAEAYDDGYDDGWYRCVDAFDAWEADQQQFQQAVHEPRVIASETISRTVMLEANTDVLPVLAIPAEPATEGEPTLAEVAASRRAHGYHPELEAFVTAPQPVQDLPEGEGWTDDSIGLLRQAWGVIGPIQEVAHEEIAPALPATAQVRTKIRKLSSVAFPRLPEPAPEPTTDVTTVGDILAWGRDQRADCNSWRDEDWATTMPWEREEMQIAA
jgi:hypothetical protein